MNTKINASLESINVTEKNALEFMLFYNNNLIKRYICSQLKINHHLKPILEIMNYKGEISDPLDQIINNTPLLWEEIIKYDSKSKIYKLYDNDFFYQILNTSELIYDVEFNIKDKLKALRSKLDNISKYNIIAKKVINFQINELEQKLIDEKWEINHYYSDEETQKLWKSLIKETIHQIKLESKEISSINISDYMLEKVSINFYLEQLKKDIVLNYNLIMYIFANKDKDQTLKQILDEIISIFDESLLNEDKIKYRDFNYNKKFSEKMVPYITNHLEIENKMNELNDKYEKTKNITDDELYIKKVIEIFQEFIIINPYNQNNGRISRYLFNLLLLKRGIIPPTLYENHSKRYQIDRLSDEYILGNKTLLNDYIFDRIKKFNNMEVSKYSSEEKIKIKTK